MSRDEKIVMVLKRVLPIMSILTVFVFVMLINKKSYALFHKRIETDITIHISTADKLPPKKTGPANDVVKGKVVSNVTDTCTSFKTKGGLVAINADGTLYQEGSGQEIREYRYVGPDVDNYIYFNCQDGKEQNGDNCEIWRILGIFKDESGAEHIKIVRNETLKGDMMPSKFSAENGTEYRIRYSSSENAYWNYPTSGTRNNDWATGGLQYWLNAGSDKETSQPSDGYMSYLSKNAKSMIEETKYYLGTVTIDSLNIIDTSKEAYANERDVESCIENTGKDKSESGCKVWASNQATWNGNIALMYPSDYGYTANSCNWNTTLYRYDTSSIKSTSWLNSANHSTEEWLLSPSSHDSASAVAVWLAAGSVKNNGVSNNGFGVRPSLNLISGVTIVNGEGTVDEPYQLNSGQ